MNAGKTSLRIFVAGIIGLSFIILPNKVSAINYSDFKPGRIIDDVVFTNKSSMTVDQIQAFLNSKVPVCETRKQASFTGTSGTIYYAPFTCLKDYQENITTGVNNYGKYADDNITPLPVAGGISAAQIIWQVAQDYNINPQVLLVTIQKEQALITDTWPILPQFIKATGYRCPDSVLGVDVDANQNGCYDANEGFYKQVSGTGWQLRNDFNGIGSPGFWSPFTKGINNILYSPDPKCGFKTVNIETQATAILYKYTPYTPNDAAITAAPGVEVKCGAYGNRNFWRLFTNWFGLTLANDTLSPHPDGTIVTDGQKVFMIEGGKKRHIASPLVLFSNNYDWNDVVQASTGDKNLPSGPLYGQIAPGTLLRTTTSPVYVVEYEANTLKKKQVTYAAFIAHKYKWSDVQVVDESSLPPLTASTMVTPDSMPSGSIVTFDGDPKAYLIDNGRLRHIINEAAFLTNGYTWAEVKKGTPLDKTLPLGDPINIRIGTVTEASGNVYVIGQNSIGVLKRPIGPWECLAERYLYQPKHIYKSQISELPTSTGSLLTC